MNNDWTDILRDKLAEYEVTPPEGLWQEIDEATNPKPHRRIGWIAIAAVCVALLVGLSLYIRPEKNVEDVISENLVFADNTLQDEEPVAETNQLKDEASEEKTAKLVAENRSVTKEPTEKDCPEKETAEELPEIETVEELPEIETTDELPELPLQIDNALLTQTDNGFAESYRRNKHDKRLSLSLHAANLSFSSTNNGKELLYNSPSIGQDPYMQDSTFVETRSLRTTQDETIESKHHRPRRLGISLSYPLSERLSLTSGISFSHLVSEITHSKESYIFTEKQKLTYIGIPVGATYRVYDYKAVSLYLSVGGMVEQCVSGEEKCPQFSTFAGSGLQVALGKYLSLYAEPRLSYYLDNNSDVINIYKDKTTTFDFNIGIRVNFSSP